MSKSKSKTSTVEAASPAKKGKLTTKQASSSTSKSSRGQADPKVAIGPAGSAKTTATASSAATTEKTKNDKLSALDAAAKVLAETGQPMTCQDMIDAMAQKGYWSSPGGRTPAATLYSAILRELKTKGNNARFVKTQRGKFTRQ
jgi:HB1, ASXL, restriction endonuclease HTH domain